jgi:hypothetical protein
VERDAKRKPRRPTSGSPALPYPTESCGVWSSPSVRAPCPLRAGQHRTAGAGAARSRALPLFFSMEGGADGGSGTSSGGRWLLRVGRDAGGASRLGGRRRRWSSDECVRSRMRPTDPKCPLLLLLVGGQDQVQDNVAHVLHVLAMYATRRCSPAPSFSSLSSTHTAAAPKAPSEHCTGPPTLARWSVVNYDAGAGSGSLGVAGVPAAAAAAAGVGAGPAGAFGFGFT